ncbi:hypothetical protein [Nitrobacter sp. 62-13]|uniref:hypothetical protein n=1 Tax=Nitrobacter sp. 62-13 TaxID=1895797 RepID=UPI000A78171A|nr:hypothetical protein [Nitrobacter sp. 62-13]
MKVSILVGAATLLFMPATTFACSPAPSCWIKSGPEYLRSVCRGFAKDHQSLPEIAKNLEEPEKIGEFAKGCKRLGIILSNQPSPNASFAYVRRGNVYVKVGDQERRLTFSGRDSDPVLAPDAQFVVFTRSNGQSSQEDCISGPMADELRRVNVDGSAEEVLLLGHAGNGASDQLCFFNEKQFTSTGEQLFFLSPAWVTSSALHSYDLREKKENYVIPANDLIVLNFCAHSDYLDAIVVKQHRYRVTGGSYDWYWLFDRSGHNERGLVGDYSDRTSAVSAMKETCK